MFHSLKLPLPPDFSTKAILPEYSKRLSEQLRTSIALLLARASLTLNEYNRAYSVQYLRVCGVIVLFYEIYLYPFFVDVLRFD